MNRKPIGICIFVLTVLGSSFSGALMVNLGYSAVQAICVITIVFTLTSAIVLTIMFTGK